MEIVPRPGGIRWGPAAALIFTSQHGVAAAADDPDRKMVPCHCVGRATARAAEAAGWPVETVAETAGELVESLSDRHPDGPLLHIGGKERRGDIAGKLRKAGLQAAEWVAYDQVLRPFSDEALAVLDGEKPVIAPLFSPRTARHFCRIHRGRAPLWLPVLSAAVSEPLDTLGVQAIRIADRPDADSMVAATLEMVQAATRVEGAPPAH